jgi:drug/metabolite transporter (DMT)-like permease
LRKYYIGLFFAILTSSIFTANYLLSKYILALYQPLVVVTYWSLGGFLVSFLYFFTFNRQRLVNEYNKSWRHLLVLGAIALIGITTWFLGNYYLGPSLNSLMARMRILFSIMLGIFLLKEKLNRYEVISILIVFYGVYLIFYSPGLVSLMGIIVAGISAFLYSFQSFYFKKHLVNSDIFIISVYRLGFVALTLAGYLWITGGFQPITSPMHIILFAAAGTIGAVVGRWANFKTLKYLDI